MVYVIILYLFYNRFWYFVLEYDINIIIVVIILGIGFSIDKINNNKDFTIYIIVNNN